MSSGLTTSDINQIYASANRQTGDMSLDITQPDGLLPHVKLLSHQRAAIQWMHSRELDSSSKFDDDPAVGGILADEPGLGKTLSTLGLLLEGRSEKINLPNLIVSPTPVIAAQWKDEIMKYIGVDESFDSHLVDTDKIKLFLYQGPPVPYDEKIANEIVIKMNQSELVLADLPTVKKELHYISAQTSGRSKLKFISPLFKTHWRRVVVDEVQDVEGQATAAAKVLRSLNTQQRWGVSGTCITNGLDALKGLAEFLGIRPYCNTEWWNANITRENRNKRMEHLCQFAALHMWRSRHIDIEHQIPPQTHLAPVFVTSSQSEFALLYPSIKNIAKTILEQINQLGWKGDGDETPLSNQDLKALLSGGSTNDMYRAAVSVRLIEDMSTNSTKKGGGSTKIKKSLDKKQVLKDLKFTSMSSQHQVLMNHSKWRLKADKIVNSYLNKLYGSLKIYYMNPPVHDATTPFDVTSFEILMKCYTLIKMLEKNNFHISSSFKLKVTFQLHKIWFLKSDIEQSIYNLEHVKLDSQNDIIARDNIARVTKDVLTSLKYERSECFISLLMINYEHLLIENREKDSTMASTMASFGENQDSGKSDGSQRQKKQRHDMRRKVVYIGMRAWRLIWSYADDTISSTARDISLSIIKKSNLELKDSFGELKFAKNNVISYSNSDKDKVGLKELACNSSTSLSSSSSVSSPHMCSEEGFTYESLQVSTLELDINANSQYNSPQICFRRSPNPSFEIKEIVSTMLYEDAENIFNFDLASHIESLKITFASFYYNVIHKKENASKSVQSNKFHTIGVLFHQLINTCEKSSIKNRFFSQISDKSISIVLTKFCFQYVISCPIEGYDTMEQLRMFFVEFLSSILGHRSEAFHFLEPIMRSCEVESISNPDSMFMARLMRCHVCVSGVNLNNKSRGHRNRQNRGSGTSWNNWNNYGDGCPLCAASQAAYKYKDHFEYVDGSLSIVMDLVNILDKFEEVKSSSSSSSTQAPQASKSPSACPSCTNNGNFADKDRNTGCSCCSQSSSQSSIAWIKERMSQFRSEAQAATKLCKYVSRLVFKCVKLRASMYGSGVYRSLVSTAALLDVKTPDLLSHKSGALASAEDRYENSLVSSGSYSRSRSNTSDPFSKKTSVKHSELVCSESMPTKSKYLALISGDVMEELDSILGFVSYLEIAAKLGNVKLKHEITNVSENDLQCALCQTQDLNGNKSRVLLCSHILCEACARSSEHQHLNDSADSFSSKPQGRQCPVCSYSQPFQLSNAPLIQDHNCEVDNNDETDDIYKDVIGDGDIDEDMAGKDDLDDVDNKDVDNNNNDDAALFEFSKQGIEVGMKVARLVKGFGVVIGVIKDCQYTDEGEPQVLIEDFCRTWLEPFHMETNDNVYPGSNDNVKKRSRKNEVDTQENLMTDSIDSKGLEFSVSASIDRIASSSNEKDWSHMRVVSNMDELQTQMALAVKLSTKNYTSSETSSNKHYNHVIAGFGSKIDELVKLIVELKRKNPKTKSLVFSQWPDALQLVQEALTMNSVCSLILTSNKAGEEALRRFRGHPTTSLKKVVKKKKCKKSKNGNKNNTFQEELEADDDVVDEREGADIQVLLMPLKSSNAGLSINEATHVFLLDTGLNRGLEIQALARVRRINSTQSTSVHRFIMQGTIEAATWELLSRAEALLHGNAEYQGRAEEDESSVLTQRHIDIKRCDVYGMISSLAELYDGGKQNASGKATWKQGIISQFAIPGLREHQHSV